MMGGGMLGGSIGGFGLAGGLIGLLLNIAIIVGIVLLIVWAVKQFNRSTGTSPRLPTNPSRPARFWMFVMPEAS
jgi:predicted lipid-binding transport protein (Tim44 family)